MSLYIVDIHGELEGDYDIVKKYEEPKTGHRVSGDLLGGLYCSECMTCLKDYFKYCPNCGAKMAETEE